MNGLKGDPFKICVDCRHSKKMHYSSEGVKGCRFVSQRKGRERRCYCDGFVSAEEFIMGSSGSST